MVDDVSKQDFSFDDVFNYVIAPVITHPSNSNTFPEKYDAALYAEIAKNGSIWAMEKVWRIECLIAIKENAARENVKAQFDLAEIYYDRKHYEEAITWYKKSANNGCPEAQWMTGNLYHYGQGVPENNEEAVKWWTLAANQQFKPAQQIMNIINKEKQNG